MHDAVLAMAADRDEWTRGRELFGRVRAAGVGAEDHQSVFRLAELVAKVAHNTAGPPPYFDHHAGWDIGPLVCRIAAASADPALRDRLEAALGDRLPSEHVVRALSTSTEYVV
ncbi:hypothetical protein ACFVOK_03865 [Streptomyces sp. NPDC057798]|uniref:hypothetical protein n=1 Tax=Streptomyces sp. NPDC057798 TaxID=3346252 RepID=UPI0036B457D8